jgi:hypothetical protein
MLYDPKREVSTVLLLAANEVRTRGLAKGEQMDAQGRVCLHGAIRLVCVGKVNIPGNDTAIEADHRVCDYLREVCGVSDYIVGGGAAWWNNMPERTAEEVVGALEGAADCR